MIDEKRAEHLSALFDGTLGYPESRKLWKQMESDPELIRQWDRYSRISQLLNHNPGVLPDAGFVNRVQAALANEPTVLLPGQCGIVLPSGSCRRLWRRVWPWPPSSWVNPC